MHSYYETVAVLWQNVSDVFTQCFLVLLLRKPLKFGSFSCDQSFVCEVWLSSGVPEFFTFSYCAWLWIWLIGFCNNRSRVVFSPWQRHAWFQGDQVLLDNKVWERLSVTQLNFKANSFARLYFETNYKELSIELSPRLYNRFVVKRVAKISLSRHRVPKCDVIILQTFPFL